MNSYKRIICGLLAVVMTASAASCGSKSDDSGNASGGDKTVSASDGKRQREDIPMDPVTETLSGFDLSFPEGADAGIPEDFIYESEAEDGNLSAGAGTLDKSFLGEFTGTGFATLPNDESVEFDIDLPAEGSYDLVIRSAADSEGIQALITVDGNSLTSFEITSTKFEENTAYKVLIGEGTHSVGIKAQANPIYIDSFTIKPAEKIDPAAYEVNRTLSNPNATDETKRLYNFMCDAYGKYIISGQYASDNHGLESREFIEIEKNLGDYPAIMGLDLIELSPSRVAHGSSGGYEAIMNAKDWWINHNGIVTICWHWNAPEPYIMKNGGAWWQGFYTEYTDIKLDAIMNGKDQEGYDLLMSDLDSIAAYLQELDDYHVPVLWRPLHEGGGDPKWNNPWFWWGSSGADAYKWLWQTMYDKFTNEYEINNLIWVWNGQNANYYPGDEYVDIVGYDVYADAGDYSSKKWYYDFTKDCAGENKIVALTENGTLFDPDAAMNDGTRWSYFATWNGEFTLKDLQLPGEYTDMDMWQKIYSNERVLTLGELPDLKNYPLDTEKYLEEHPDEAPKN